MGRPWRRQAIPVAEALAEVARALGIEGRLKEAEVLRLWPRAVGRAAAEHSRPARLRGGTLLVHTTDSAWLHRLSMMRRDIARTVNDHLGVALVKQVRLRVGPVGEGDTPARRPGPGRALPPTGGAGLEDPAVARALAPIHGLPVHGVVRRILLRQAAGERAR